MFIYLNKQFNMLIWYFWHPLFHLMCAAPSGEDRFGKHSRTGAGGTCKPTLETHGQIGGREKVMSPWNDLWDSSQLAQFSRKHDHMTLPLPSHWQDSAGEAWPASVSPALTTRSFYGDRLSWEHDAAHPLPEEWSGEAQTQSPHYRTTAWVFLIVQTCPLTKPLYIQ